MKKKYLLIIAIILLIISIVFIAPLAYSIVEMELAEYHYKITERVDGSQTHYGCGDYQCKYCRGKDNATSIYFSFVFVQIMNDLFLASVVIVPVFALGAITMFIVFVAINRKSKKVESI